MLDWSRPSVRCGVLLSTTSINVDDVPLSTMYTFYFLMFTCVLRPKFRTALGLPLPFRLKVSPPAVSLPCTFTVCLSSPGCQRAQSQQQPQERTLTRATTWSPCGPEQWRGGGARAMGKEHWRQRRGAQQRRRNGGRRRKKEGAQMSGQSPGCSCQPYICPMNKTSSPRKR